VSDPLSRKAIGSDNGAALGPAQKRSFNQGIDDLSRGSLIQPPQPRRLGQRQLKAGHLDELAPDAVNQSMKVHGRGLSNSWAMSGTGPHPSRIPKLFLQIITARSPRWRSQQANPHIVVVISGRVAQ
jgi:hypothetical protein